MNMQAVYPFKTKQLYIVCILTSVGYEPVYKQYFFLYYFFVIHIRPAQTILFQLFIAMIQ